MISTIRYPGSQLVGSLKLIQSLRQLILLRSSNVREFRQQGQLQRKRLLKVNIWELVTILLVLLLPRILALLLTEHAANKLVKARFN